MNKQKIKDALPIGPVELTWMMALTMALNAMALDSMLPAFPQMQASFGLSGNEVQYIIGIYLVGMGAGAIIYGPLSDRYGRKPVMLSTMILFAIISFICGFTDNFILMLWLRLAQGLCGAAMGVLVMSIIRDKFEGDAMAKRMSLIFLTFMIVPIIAPTIGQAILWFADWHYIFILLSAIAIVMAIWVLRRLPETLAPENMIPIKPSVIAKTWKIVISNRHATAYVGASGMTQAGLYGYLSSAQQIFDIVFDAADFFIIGFAIIAIGIAVTNFTNSKIVMRFGARRVSHTALFIFIIFGFSQIMAALYYPASLPLFLGLITVNMAMIGFTSSNFSAIAMQPFGAMAGTASSFQTFLRTVTGAALGALIGQQFDGSMLPVAIGFAVSGLIALILILIAENGKLFTRPNQVPPANIIESSSANSR